VSADRPTQFRQALDAIHRRWGSEALQPLATLSAASGCIPTGYPELDRVLGGGIPCGKITELSGIPTCGVTTLALKIVAQAQLQGRLGIYVDLAQSFDPGYAIGYGVQLDGLLIARPRDPAGALDILQIVAEEGGADLAVLDPAPGDDIRLGRALRKLSPALRRSGCTALLLNSGTMSASLAQQASLRLALENTRWLENTRDIYGCRTRITVLKDRRSHPDRHSDIDILLDDPVQGEVA
jgi:recombination protein RecA